MPLDIPTTEAKLQSLPGSDVYRYSHLLYNDDVNRDFGVVRLNIEALKAFSDSITVGHRHELMADRTATEQWIAKGSFQSGTPDPWGAISWKSLEYVNYEHLKIASAFELHLKSRLLARNYVLHEIDSQSIEYRFLAKQQRTRPIAKQELLAIRSYHFDGKQNYLPGLKDSTLGFSVLTQKPAYVAALGLTPRQMNIIEDYRVLRNQIHFPGDVVEAPNIQAFGRPIVEFLVPFINIEVVAWSNSLSARHKLNYPRIANLG